MSDGDTLLRLIPLLPLVGAVLHGVSIGVVRRIPPRWAVWGVSCAAAVLSYLLSLIAFFRLVALPDAERSIGDTLYTWIGAGIGDSRLAVDLGFHLDPLAVVLLLLVTGLAVLVHVYAIAYMEHDPRDDRGFQRFFCYLNLLLFSMLVLVLADNLVLLFVGWEGIALGCYLMVGFWYSDERNARAASEVFVAGRIGDLGYLIGSFLLFTAFLEAELPASLLFSDLALHHDAIAELSLATPLGVLGGSVRVVDAVAWCFLLPVCAKAAQIPLAFWIRNAGFAPPPAAALIHAAIPSAAAVYLVCRLSFVFAAAPGVLSVMAWIGVLTAALAALLAAAQLDMRRVLVLLAMSQQGFLFLALACADFTAALFHLLAQGFVMALLFLGAGSVSLALQHEWSLERTGGLGRRLTGTCWAFRIGVAVMAGVPLGSVFFSRGSILVAIFGSELPGRDWLYGLALATTAMIAFASCRLYFLIFSGSSRVVFEVRDRIRESSPLMLWCLYAIAGFAALGGVFGTPQTFGDAMPWEVESSHSLANFLATTLPGRPPEPLESVQLTLMALGVLASGAGFGIAYLVYRARPEFASRVAESIPTLRSILQHGFWQGSVRAWVIERPLHWFAERVLLRGIEQRLLDGLLVEGPARLLCGLTDRGIRYLQTGLAHAYVFFMIAGAAAIVGYVLR